MAQLVLPAIPSLSVLGDLTGNIVRVAADTEFSGPTTLTVQFAVRIKDAIIVQIYRSPLVPPPPAGFGLRSLQQLLRKHCRQLILRPVKVLKASLSPVRVLADLLQLEALQSVSRINGDDQHDQHELGEKLTLMLIAHYWPADFFRVFGRKFFANLMRARSEQQAALSLQGHKVISFKDTRRRYSDPVLQYALEEGTLHPLHVRMFDTVLPFGNAPLDSLAKTFLDLNKLGSITQKDKEHMLKTFRSKTVEAYRYAALDAILALLVEEKMRAADQHMYATLGFEEQEVPALRPTQGSRVAELILKSIGRTSAAGSVRLSCPGKLKKDGSVGKLSMGKIKALLAQGAGVRIATERRSRFGEQTGETHGGLLFTRSPDQLFHAAPGQFRDVDLSSCYANVISGLNLYVGQPLIHEPGAKKMNLKEAVVFVETHAAGRDAWIIKVSGPVKHAPNVLIPSTKDAVTNSNFKIRSAKKRAKQRRYGFVLDWVLPRSTRTGNTVIYTDVIESGIVAWATWLMIQALPERWRREYENLEVESIVFYPAQLVADSGPEFDRLCDEFAAAGTPWQSTLDMTSLRQITEEQLDDEYVSLRFPIGKLAEKISGFRKKAKQKHGKGSAAEQGWKQHANSLYGVAASRHLVTNNVVLANVITATARALAFAMQLSLNGIQVITDGCTYRRDKVPAVTLAECLAAANDYPIHLVDAGVSFHDPGDIPDADVGFTAWYRQHVLNFFSISGSDYDWLFGLHDLEHKRCGPEQTVAFDGLCCDRAANYVKLLQNENGSDWTVLDFKARSYGRAAKEQLAPWIVSTYVDDDYQGPPPIIETSSLLSCQEAVRVSRQALRELKKSSDSDEPIEILFPLGFSQLKAQAYKVIKESAFLFRTPEQRARVVKQIKKFTDACACGLEVLSLRQTRAGRRHGSLSDVARNLYLFIRAGKDNLTKEFNLNRSFAELEAIKAGHFADLERRKRELRLALYQGIDAREVDHEALLTGLLVGEGHHLLDR